MISVGNENKTIKNKERWNYYHCMPMISLLGANHRLPLFHMTTRFIWLNVAKQRINEFTIGYMINPGFNVNKTFREQVKNVCILHLVKAHNLLLKPNNQK